MSRKKKRRPKRRRGGASGAAPGSGKAGVGREAAGDRAKATPPPSAAPSRRWPLAGLAALAAAAAAVAVGYVLTQRGDRTGEDPPTPGAFARDGATTPGTVPAPADPNRVAAGSPAPTGGETTPGPPRGITDARARDPAPAPPAPVRRRRAIGPQSYTQLAESEQPRIYQWFGGVPAEIQAARLDPGPASNIHRGSYAGPDSCLECHPKNHGRWSDHPHRWMNAWADETTVKGDFSGRGRISYQGGVGTFFKTDGGYRMRLERGGVRRTFAITRTIGSRFFQYYVARLEDGPEPEGHALRRTEHVMPFGYWFEPGEWVPIVNVNEETPDEGRDDAFDDPGRLPYDRSCSFCHTTRPTGDWLLSNTGMTRLDAYSPRVVHFDAEAYLDAEHPGLTAHLRDKPALTQGDAAAVLDSIKNLPAKEHAVTLGVSCEACHNGCADHVADEDDLPSFFPRSPLVHFQGNDPDFAWGRNDTNANWVCSRCHTGGRARYANGASTWNSTELSDAARGSCYNSHLAGQKGMKALTCIHCHSPHRGIGQKWSRTQEQDNASCTACHEQFEEPAALTAHTHHPAGSAGSACMNCHMPRINEGLQDVVRTHTIFSPSEPRMIEANQPNACNLCHVDRPIDWSLRHLKAWYGAGGYDEEKLAANYPRRDGPAALGWLASEHHGTRLVAADALARQGARWALPQLVKALDDPYLLNRQFTGRALEKMLGVDLRDHGYRFYHFAKERAGPLERIRQALLAAEPRAGAGAPTTPIARPAPGNESQP